MAQPIKKTFQVILGDGGDYSVLAYSAADAIQRVKNGLGQQGTYLQRQNKSRSYVEIEK